MLSENGKFLEHLINHWNLKADYYLKLWSELKEKDSGFDKKNTMVRILLAHGAQVLDEEKPNKEKTAELMLKIIKEDSKICSKNSYKYGKK